MTTLLWLYLLGLVELRHECRVERIDWTAYEVMRPTLVCDAYLFVLQVPQ